MAKMIHYNPLADIVRLQEQIDVLDEKVSKLEKATKLLMEAIELTHSYATKEIECLSQLESHLS